MDASSSQPLVTVKKADGSVVRVTLGELEALKKKSGSLPPTPSLLLASDNRAAEVERVMKEVGQLVGPDIQNRLRSVIQLYLKDVRDHNETAETLERRTQDGGLGLSKADVAVVLAAIKKTIPESAAAATTFTLKDKKNNVPDLELAETVPTPPAKTREPMVVASAGLPAMTSPNNAFKHPARTEKKELPLVSLSSKVTPPTPPQPPKKTSAEFAEMLRAVSSSAPLEIHDLLAAQPAAKTVAPAPQPLSRPEAPLRLSTAPLPRPFVRDVAAVTYEVGPVDEIARITLVDFRRLAQNPVEAAQHLKDKFFNLKDESIVLYLQALEAWRRSPLYLDYVSALVASLAEHRPLAAVLAGKKGIELPEIEALVAMENEF